MPISVHVPPKIDANESGIITCSLGMLMFSAHRCTIGIITATTGVLFRNAEVKAIGTASGHGFGQSLSSRVCVLYS